MSDPTDDVPHVAETLTSPPRGTWSGLLVHARYDLLSGFLVFLIALPLCLAISLASGFPAVAGIFTAVMGGTVAALFSDSELAIKGPAAGLIVIVLGCVKDFGFTGGEDPAADFSAYRLALGVVVVAAAFQILLALIRAGVLAEFFPTSAVHGMLAAIGVIIIAKQIPIALGLRNDGTPLTLLARIPENLARANPEIALIGGLSLLIMFCFPRIRIPAIRRVPPQLIVVLLSIGVSIYFDLHHPHSYALAGHEYQIESRHVVSVPDNLATAITLPDFSGLREAKAWRWILLFTLIGSLESTVCTKAVDLLDPWKRKTNLNRDLLAVGIGNLLVGCLGGLPMISEIVRSRANIDSGARTRFSNMYHGLFLLLCVALFPAVIHRIPQAALAAMLIFTGFRLAHPKEFVHAWKVGSEQLLVYCVTIAFVLIEDLLVGVLVGMTTEFAIHLWRRAPFGLSLFRPVVRTEELPDGTCRLVVCDSAIFSNWIPLRAKVLRLGLDRNCSVAVDLSAVRLVDHTVMAKLHDLARDFEQRGLKFELVGLDAHRAVSEHPFAARVAPRSEAAGAG